jgi:hypothetical protein
MNSKELSLLIIPLLVLAPTMAMTPAQYGAETGKGDGQGDVRDSIDACSKYSGIYSYNVKYNDSRPAAIQCYNAYNIGFKEGCKHHVRFVPDSTGPPEYPTCEDYYKDANQNAFYNELSYNYGYDGAFGILNCLAHMKSDCDIQHGYSFDKSLNQSDACNGDSLNMTACSDGYADGFAHWCAKNVADCSKQVRVDAIPHIQQNSTSTMIHN